MNREIAADFKSGLSIYTEYIGQQLFVREFG